MPRRITVGIVAAVAAGALVAPSGGRALAVPNPVATDAATYAAYGRVFPDPHGCLSHDTDGDDTNDVVAPNASPWAKGNVCVGQFLTYEEFVTGAKLLESLYPRYFDLIRLDEAYDNPNYRSAGLGRMVAFEDGRVQTLGRDRRPLYLFKLTDRRSPIPESMRLHFAYSASIHGIERAGAEGGIRAAEDLVTWAANHPRKRIVETPTKKPVPTASDVLRRSVIYFVFPNPDGWARGSYAPIETREGSLNASYAPGFSFQRYNGNGMDLNRDFPTLGYTYRPYTPGSNPETKAVVEVLRKVRASISPRNPVGRRFAGAIDLHGQLFAPAFSFTLLGASQKDYRKNFSTVDQGLRTWADQTARLAWSPYIGSTFETADQWGSVIDTLGYQITGGVGDWFENEQLGLGAIGVDNEMSLSHIVPNSVFDPVTEQMHIDGNKGLIYSQLSSILTERPYRYRPPGRIGYVRNPVRVRVPASARRASPGLPAQDDIDVIIPCQDLTSAAGAVSCDQAGASFDAASNALEFDVRGPKDGVWNGGISVEMTNVNVLSSSPGSISRVLLERLDDDHAGEAEWEVVRESFVQAGSPDAYLPAGQETVTNDPVPGRWRVRVSPPLTGPARIKVDFDPATAEMSPGQARIDASSMDFFDELNRYVPDPHRRAEAVEVRRVISDPGSLAGLDTLVVVNHLGQAGWLKRVLKLSDAEVRRYFASLGRFAREGGNLVLTDSALRALPELGVVKAGDVRGKRVLAGRYEFGEECGRHKLSVRVCLDGTAGGTSRQAVEPVPLGYSPDLDLDDDPNRMMPEWSVSETAWNRGCSGVCTHALVQGQTGLGERHFGRGRIRIAGAMFPDPNYHPGEAGDMRFGLASYSLTFSAWQIFLNLVNYRR